MSDLRHDHRPPVGARLPEVPSRRRDVRHAVGWLAVSVDPQAQVEVGGGGACLVGNSRGGQIAVDAAVEHPGEGG